MGSLNITGTFGIGVFFRGAILALLVRRSFAGTSVFIYINSTYEIKFLIELIVHFNYHLFAPLKLAVWYRNDLRPVFQLLHVDVKSSLYLKIRNINYLLPDIMPKLDTPSKSVLPMASIRPGKI
jgi:hypothetical protein